MARASKKESILDLERYLNQNIIVKFTGGREVTGILRRYDNLVNLVLDEAEESVKPPNNPDLPSVMQRPSTRYFGKVVCKGSSVMLIAPADGTHELIENPYEEAKIQQQI